MGINKLVEILNDNSELIRNEMILLLESLTIVPNLNIQKIIGFQGTFDTLFNICKEEDYTKGGIIVQDCLRLILNLLRENLSNQNFFRESGCLSSIINLLKPCIRVIIYYFICLDDTQDESCCNIVSLALDICVSIVGSITHKDQSKNAALQTQNRCGNGALMTALLELAISDFTSTTRRRKIFSMISYILHGNNKNQLTFASLQNIRPVTNTKSSLESLGELYGFQYNFNFKKTVLLQMLDYCFIHYSNYEIYSNIAADLKAKHDEKLRLIAQEKARILKDKNYRHDSIDSNEDLKLEIPTEYLEEAIAAEILIQAYFFRNSDGQMLFASTFSAFSPDLLSDPNFTLPFGRQIILSCHRFFAQSQPNPSEPKPEVPTHITTPDSPTVSLMHNNSFNIAKEAKASFLDTPTSLNFFCSIRLILYVLRSQKDVKEVLLRLPLEIPENEVSVPPVLPDLLMYGLLQSEGVLHESLLFLLCEWCYDNKMAVDMFFKKPPNKNPFFAHLISCASNSTKSIHCRGLVTFLLSLCLDIHRDSLSAFHNPASLLPPSLLFEIITNQIGIDQYKKNMDDFASLLKDHTVIDSNILTFDSINKKSNKQIYFLYDLRFLDLFKQIHLSSEKLLLKLFSSAAQYAFSIVNNNPSTNNTLSPRLLPQVTTLIENEFNNAMALELENLKLKNQGLTISNNQLELDLQSSKNQYNLHSNEFIGQIHALNAKISEKDIQLIANAKDLEQLEGLKLDIEKKVAENKKLSLVVKELRKAMLEQARLNTPARSFAPVLPSHANSELKLKLDFSTLQQYSRPTSPKTSAKLEKIFVSQEVQVSEKDLGIESFKSSAILNVNPTRIIDPEAEILAYKTRIDELETLYCNIKIENEDLLLLLLEQEETIKKLEIIPTKSMTDFK